VLLIIENESVVLFDYIFDMNLQAYGSIK